MKLMFIIRYCAKRDCRYNASKGRSGIQYLVAVKRRRNRNTIPRAKETPAHLEIVVLGTKVRVEIPKAIQIPDHNDSKRNPLTIIIHTHTYFRFSSKENQMKATKTPEADPSAFQTEGLERRLESDIFTTCFVCGPDRNAGDGLRLFAGMPPGNQIDGHLKPVAAAWKPFANLSSNGQTIDEAHIWAAMDCPSAAAINNTGDETKEPIACLLGRFKNTVYRAPKVDEHCAVVAQMDYQEGRKIFCNVSLFGGQGDLLAAGRTTWIALEDISAFEAN
mgnify:CR=1 FL=1